MLKLITGMLTTIIIHCQLPTILNNSLRSANSATNYNTDLSENNLRNRRYAIELIVEDCVGDEADDPIKSILNHP